MKFSCDSCHAQYMISDEKVGAAGVRVRCKKCGNVIHVKRVEEAAPPQEDATVVMTADKLAQIRDELDAARGVGPGAVTSPPKVTADEIGKAFDSMFSEHTAEDGAVQPPQAAAAPSAPPVGQGEDPDRAETRVLTAGDMQRISSELAPPAPPAVFETEKTVAAPYAIRPPSTPGMPVEWFVAIRDEQVGPLTPEGVKERWDRGEVGPDTLCWCSGLPDWKPLSSVDELAHLVAPAPTATVRNGAGAAVQSSPSRAPAAPSADDFKPEDSLGEFKPSAASALASLASMAQEEMDAADRAKAAPKPPEPEPELAPVRRSSPSRIDLFNDLPPPEAAASAPSQAAVTAASSFGAPAPLADAYSPPSRRAEAAFGRPDSSNLKLVVIGGVALIVILAMAGVLFWALVLKPQKDAQDRRIAELAAAAAAAKPPAPVPVAAPVPVPVPAPIAAPVAPTGAVAVAKPPVAPAPAPAPADDRKHHGGTGGKHHHGDETAAATPGPSAPTAANPAPPAPAGGKTDDFLGGTGVDKAFENELNGSPDQKTPPKHDVYIPPPPGQADLPQELGQSDVMEVIVEHKGNFAKCKNDHPGGGGTVVMHWRIKPDGHTTDVRRNGGELDNPPLAKCIQAAVSKLRFGQYRGPAMAPIDFPFSF